MKRHQLFSWMLGIAVASAIALTGCDDVLENGSETPAYSIVLSEEEAYVFKSAETELALLVVNSGDEATGALTAELTGDSEAFTLSKTKLPSIKAGKSGTLVIAPVAGLATGTYEAAVVLSGEAGIAATLDVSYTVAEEAGVLTVTGAEDGVVYEAEVYDYPDNDIADAADLRYLMSVVKIGGTGVGTADNGTLEIGLQTPDGADFTSDGTFLVVLKDATDGSAPFKYKGAVPFTGGGATLDWNDMENTPVTGSERPEEPEFYIVTFDGYEQAGEQRRWRGFVGDIIERPIDPTRDGFIFDGWYADAAFAIRYDFESLVTDHITLYAKWIAAE